MTTTFDSLADKWLNASQDMRQRLYAGCEEARGELLDTIERWRAETTRLEIELAALEVSYENLERESADRLKAIAQLLATGKLMDELRAKYGGAE